MELPKHESFPKIKRFKSDLGVVVTEKIDGTNGLVYVDIENDVVQAGSRNRWITPDDDNAGFAKFVQENREDLKSLGNGWHYGEWWGQGIQRRYDMDRKVFSLFNSERFTHPDSRPECCDVVPVLYKGSLSGYELDLPHSVAADKYGVHYERVEGSMLWLPDVRLYLKHIVDK